MSKKDWQERKRDRKRDRLSRRGVIGDGEGGKCWIGVCRENRGMELRFIIPTLVLAAFTIHHISCREDYRTVGFERLIVLSVV